MDEDVLRWTQKIVRKFISKENTKLFFREILNSQVEVVHWHVVQIVKLKEIFLRFWVERRMYWFYNDVFSHFFGVPVVRLRADNLLQSSTLRLIKNMLCSWFFPGEEVKSKQISFKSIMFLFNCNLLGNISEGPNIQKIFILLYFFFST